MNMNLNKREIKEDAAPGKSLKKEQKKEPEKNFKKPVTKWNLLRLIDECEGKRFGETGNTRMNVSEDKEQ